MKKRTYPGLFTLLLVALLLVGTVLGACAQPAPPSPFADLAETFVDEIGCPVSFLGSSAVTEVTAENVDDVVDDIVDETAILNIADDVCLGVVFLRYAQLSQEELDGYRSWLADEVVEVGDRIERVSWSIDDEEFSTLGVTDEEGTPKFEPVMYFAVTETETTTGGLSSETASTTYTLTATKNMENVLGITVISATIKVIITTSDGCTIEDQSVTISFSTAPLWQAKATKSEQVITLTRPCKKTDCTWTDRVQCKKVTVTITWVNGFKKVSGSVGADGFSASLEVEGYLGANGQQQHVYTVCADGGATSDGTTVGTPEYPPCPTPTPTPTPTPAPTPQTVFAILPPVGECPQPPQVPQIGGITATHWLDGQTLWIAVHVQQNPGIAIHDMHFYMLEYDCTGSVAFPTPLEVCLEYQLYADWWGSWFPGFVPQLITIYLTNEAGNAWGWIQSVPAQ